MDTNQTNSKLGTVKVQMGTSWSSMCSMWPMEKVISRNSMKTQELPPTPALQKATAQFVHDLAMTSRKSPNKRNISVDAELIKCFRKWTKCSIK